MRLEYSITRFDLFKAHLGAMVRNRYLWLVILPVLAFTWWSTFNWQEFRYQTPAARIFVATATALACGCMGAVGACALIGLQSILRKDKGVLGRHAIEVTEEGLVESTSVNRSLMNWGGTFRIRETRRYVYVYISETNFHLIPRAGISVGSLEVFLAELRGKIKGFLATNTVAPGP